MEKHAYLLLTDLHLDIDKDNRFSYLDEVLDAMQSIISINADYTNAGYKTSVIFLGDIFDGSSNSSEESMFLLEVLKYFIDQFSAAYAVIGNHEITYRKDNPFWYMVSELEDESLSDIRRNIQPKGFQSYIKVPALLNDGDTVFYFNHFGTKPKVAIEGDVRIGLFHQNIGSTQIATLWGTYDNVETASYIQSYNYCFFGHLHLARGQYWLNEQKTCRGEWLGTLGRTNVNEVDDSNLDVNIPVIRIEDGKFMGIDDRSVTLKSFKECVNEQTYSIAKKAREDLKVRKLEAESEYIGNTLLEALKLKVNGTELGELFEVCSKELPDMVYEYESTRDVKLFEEIGNECESGGEESDDASSDVTDEELRNSIDYLIDTLRF